MHRLPHGPSRACRSLKKSLAGRPTTMQGCVTAVFGASYGSICEVQPVTATHGDVDVGAFRSLAWEPAVPVLLRHYHRLPAMTNWFTASTPERPPTLSDKVHRFGSMGVPYELVTSGHRPDSPAASSSSCLRDFQKWLSSKPAEPDDTLLCELIDNLLESTGNDPSRFLQFEAPLNFAVRASQYNGSTDNASCRIKQLYVAQCDIRSLPTPLAEDLPVPEVVSRAGRGDIYSSSIWLGLQPTYTPLHRDPNPNLFCQLLGIKTVRLLRPRTGLSVFQDVRRHLGIPINSRLRGPEMMEGPEREGLHRAIWIDLNPPKETWEAVLKPGDALFIPQGWWHSVKSVGREAELNASANWWFR